MLSALRVRIGGVVSAPRRLAPRPPAATPSSGRGFGEARGPAKESAKMHEELRKQQSLVEEVKKQRKTTTSAADLLAQLLKAQPEGEARVAEVALQHVDSLTEEFFRIGATYLDLAQQEEDKSVAPTLRAALKVAMDAKNSTLRVEIQLLNSLLRAESEAQRQQLLVPEHVVEVLQMNDYYFFTKLLDPLAKDLSRRPDGPEKMATLDKCWAVRYAALERLPEQSRSQVPAVSA